MSVATKAVGGAAVIYALLWLAAIGGWIANIVKIFGSAGEPLTAWLVLRVVGIFAAPIGAVLGYL